MNPLKTTAVLAMSADGKIADWARSPARFASPADKRHLEAQIAVADGVLFGAGTLRAYGTTLPITSPGWLRQRQEQRRPPQPIHLVCSSTGQLDPTLPFFQQPVPRWLLTTPPGEQRWQGRTDDFQQILRFEASPFPWPSVFEQLAEAGLSRLAILGGGDLVASILDAQLLDEIWLTICPLLLGGKTAPTPIDGSGLLAPQAPCLELLSSRIENHEIFVHYRLRYREN